MEDVVFPSHLSQGCDLFEIKYIVSEQSSDHKRVEKSSDNYYVSWETLFTKLAKSIYQEARESDIDFEITNIIKKENDINDNLYVSVEIRYVEQARYQFEALGLITAVSITREPIFSGRTVNDVMGVRDTYIAWTLTDKGRRYISHLKALKRPAAS